MPNKLEEAGISWVILGSQTKPTVMPKIEWVREIVEAADKAGIPVFLKDNLKPLLPKEKLFYKPMKTKVNEPLKESVEILLRQEMPVSPSV